MTHYLLLNDAAGSRICEADFVNTYEDYNFYNTGKLVEWIDRRPGCDHIEGQHVCLSIFSLFANRNLRALRSHNDLVELQPT